MTERNPTEKGGRQKVRQRKKKKLAGIHGGVFQSQKGKEVAKKNPVIQNRRGKTQKGTGPLRENPRIKKNQRNVKRTNEEKHKNPFTGVKDQFQRRKGRSPRGGGGGEVGAGGITKYGGGLVLDVGAMVFQKRFARKTCQQRI